MGPPLEDGLVLLVEGGSSLGAGSQVLLHLFPLFFGPPLHVLFIQLEKRVLKELGVLPKLAVVCHSLRLFLVALLLLVIRVLGRLVEVERVGLVLKLLLVPAVNIQVGLGLGRFLLPCRSRALLPPLYFQLGFGPVHLGPVLLAAQPGEDELGVVFDELFLRPSLKRVDFDLIYLDGTAYFLKLRLL